MKINARYRVERFSRQVLFVLSFLLILVSCEKENMNTISSSADEDIPYEIIQKLNAAGFDTSQGLRKYKGGYLVEYDIHLTAEAITSLSLPPAVSVNGRIDHYRSSLLVKATPRNLLVYMDPGFNAYMQSAFDAALARYNAVAIGLTFQRTTSLSASDIAISSFYEVSSLLGYSSSPGFPSASNPNKNIYMNTYWYNNQRADATSTIAHEIGHAIGFRHTDYMDRRFSCGASAPNPNEGPANVGAVYIPGTPTTASPGSWMLACSDGFDRPFTTDDITALTTTYPVKIAPTGFQSVYRYYSPNGDHFYTAAWGELGRGNSTYILEGTEFYIASSATYAPAPVYRYVQLSNNYHFYTTNFAELGNGGNGWLKENNLGFAFGNQNQAAGIVPIYRYVNTSNGDHFYTQVSMNYSGYISEGIAFYTYGYPY